MTKKNAKKASARARQEQLGGSYQSHLRNVGGAGSTTERQALLRQSLPVTRHVYLSETTQHELDVFTVNQSVSYFFEKFKKSGWSATTHRVDPVYHHALWVQPGPADELALTQIAARALKNVRPDGYLLVVHAAGRLAMMWSDYPVPRDDQPRFAEVFGAPLRAVPRQEILEGLAPTWWPPALQGGEITVSHRFDPDDPAYQSVRLHTGAHQEPMRPLDVVHGDRLTRVSMVPVPTGSGSWRFDIKHAGGAWPLQEAERAAVDQWLEDFAGAEWSDRTVVWPARYLAAPTAWTGEEALDGVRDVSRDT